MSGDGLAPKTLVVVSAEDMSAVRGRLEQHDIRWFPLESIAPELQRYRDDVVLLLDADATGERPWRALLAEGVLAHEAPVILVHDGAAMPAGLEVDRVFAFLRKPLNAIQVARTVRRAFEHLALQRRAGKLEARLDRRTSEFRRLLEIGMAFASEREIDKLLDLILSRMRLMTRADAGSLFLVTEPDETGERRLSFKLAQNDSIAIPFRERTMPLTKESLAGYVATTGNILVFDDVYEIADGVEYTFNRDYDREIGYRTKSVLVVPMRDYFGRIIGCVQLINRKPSSEIPVPDPASVEKVVQPFGELDTELASALAAMAAVAFENSTLYQQIESLFESFITAGAYAIESRDPSTRGHSERVANLTTGLAKVVSDIGEGRFADVSFSRQQLREIKYAGLLHDFGKIGVRESILLKPNKLYDHRLEVIKYRLGFVKRSLLSNTYREELDAILRKGREHFLLERHGMTSEIETMLHELDDFLQRILEANNPAVRELDTKEFDRLKRDLQRIADVSYEDESGEIRPLLEPDEVKALSIRRGSLDEAERLEIQSHVSHTYEFLRRIRWTHELRHVTDIAFAHHEKLDGTGYPRGLKADEIPIQAKMMTVADIYDALTASDRPYKAAVSHERAIDILADEARRGKVDADLVDVFVKRRIAEVVKRDDD